MKTLTSSNYSIESIDAVNLLGPEFHREIKPCTVLMGPNGSQKTATLNALCFALQMSTPYSEINRSDLIYKKFACDTSSKLSVGITFSSGLGIHRTLNLDSEGTIKQSVSVLGKKLKQRAAEKEIERIFKPCIKALDFENSKDGFGKPGPKARLAYLLSLVAAVIGYEHEKVSGRFIELIGNRARRCGNCRLFKMREPDRCTKGEADNLGCIEWEGSPSKVDAIKLLHRIFADWHPNSDLPQNEGLLLIKKAIREIKSELHHIEQDAGKVQEGLEELVEREKLIAGDVVTAERNLNEARSRKDELKDLIPDEEKKATAHLTWDDEKKRIEGNIEVDRKKIEALAETREAYFIVREIKDHRAKKCSAETYEQLSSEISALELKLQEAEQSRKEAEGIRGSHKNFLELVEKAIKTFDGDKVKCPIILTKDAGCRVSSKEKEKIIKAHKELRDSAQKEFDEAHKKYEEALDSEQRVASAQREAEEKKSNLEKVDVEIDQCIKTLKAKLKTPVALGKEIGKSIAANLAELETHLGNEPHEEGVLDTDKLREELAGIESRIPTLEADHIAKVEERGNKKVAIEAERKRLKAENELDIIRMLLKETDSMISSMLRETIGPVTDAISQFLTADSKAHVMIDDEGEFDIGIIKHGTFRSIDTISQGERAIFVAALAITFMTLEESRLKVVLCNEMDNLDRDYLPEFLKLMVKAVEKGYINNFIGTVNNKWMPEIEGVHVIETEVA